MVSDERYYDYMGRRLREEQEKQDVIKEEHTHTNGLMLDMKELTKCHYDVLIRNKELIEENNNFYVVNSKELKPKSQKTMEEAKGQLISDYQLQLETQWVLELKSKFEIKVNENVLQKVNNIISK